MGEDVKRVISAALAVVLAVGLLPAPAFAGELAAGRNLASQASNKKVGVYVLTGCKSTKIKKASDQRRFSKRTLINSSNPHCRLLHSGRRAT